jgi:hypothetical protein
MPRGYYRRLSVSTIRGFRRLRNLALAAAILAALAPTSGRATEGGTSLFIPGLSVPGGGLLPPEGFYFDSTALYYQAKQFDGRRTLIGGNVVSGVKVELVADFVTALWVTPVKIFGGDFAVSVSLPFGEPSVRAGALFSGPLTRRLAGRPLGLSVSDADLNLGDPVVSGILGWHHGNWHWKVAAAVSIPGGAYEKGELSNIALNRPVGDFSAGVTYLDPALGLHLSAVAGFAVNGENQATDYRSGNEFHLDVGITKYLTKEWLIGVIGSHYQQITGDSGSGARRVGSNKGRSSAVGGVLGYSLTIGHVPVSTRVKLLREFAVENRPEGTVGWLQISFPLWMPARAAAPEHAGAVRVRN